jgi:hypothetical protein
MRDKQLLQFLLFIVYLVILSFVVYQIVLLRVVYKCAANFLALLNLLKGKVRP